MYPRTTYSLCDAGANSKLQMSQQQKPNGKTNVQYFVREPPIAKPNKG